jgi:hypothetical protein
VRLLVATTCKSLHKLQLEILFFIRHHLSPIEHNFSAIIDYLILVKYFVAQHWVQQLVVDIKACSHPEYHHTHSKSLAVLISKCHLISKWFSILLNVSKSHISKQLLHFESKVTRWRRRYGIVVLYIYCIVNFKVLEISCWSSCKVFKSQLQINHRSLYKNRLLVILNKLFQLKGQWFSSFRCEFNCLCFDSIDFQYEFSISIDVYIRTHICSDSFQC